MGAFDDAFFRDSEVYGPGWRRQHQPSFTPSTPAAQLLNDSATPPSEQQLTVAGAGDVLPIIYGRAAVGPKLCAAVTDNNGCLVVLLAWALGECDAVESITVDDLPLPSGITVNHTYLGTQTQNADPTLAAAFAAKGGMPAYTDRLLGVCYSVITITPGTSSGFPRFVAFVRGLKVPLSSGASPTWTDNPAYCIADFVTSTTYGMGMAVDWTSVAALAAACDATVGGERKRMLNLALVEAQPVETWLAVLRDYAGCWTVPEGNVYRFIPDAPASSEMTFTGANIAAGSLKLAWRKAGNSPTAIEVEYTDTTAKPFRSNTVTRYAPGVLDGSVERRMSSISKPGIWRRSEANRYAVERLNESTLMSLGISFAAFDEALAIEVGSVITVTHPIGLVAQKFRVTALDPQQPGRWGVSAVRYDENKYSSEVVTGPVAPPGGIVDPSAPPAVAGLAVAEDVFQVATGLWGSRLVATWTAATFPFVDAYVVKVTQAGVLKDSGVVLPDAAPTFISKQLAENLDYVVSVQVRSTIGAISTAATSTIFNLGKLRLGKPTDVPSISGFEVGGEVRLTWVPATDLDLTAHEIRYSVTGGSWEAATLLDRIAAPGIRYESRQVPAGTWRFWIKGLDSVRSGAYPFGQESVNAAWIDITVTSDANAFLAGEYAFASATLTNMSQQRDGAGNVYWISDNGSTWNTNFTGNLSTYANVLATYPGGFTSTLETNHHDFGAIVSGTWSGVVAYSDLSGTAAAYLDLSTTDSGYSAFAALQALLAARWAKLRIVSTGTVLVTSLGLARIVVVGRTETGSVTTSSAGPATVTLVSKYVKALSIQLTPASGASANFATYDNVVVGTGTNSFDAYAFNTAGTKVAAACTYTFAGV